MHSYEMNDASASGSNPRKVTCGNFAALVQSETHFVVAALPAAGCRRGAPAQILLLLCLTAPAARLLIWSDGAAPLSGLLVPQEHVRHY